MTTLTAPIVVFPFRYRDARTGRWVKARFKAERSEIAVRYGEWEIIEPGEERRPIGGNFNPGRREGELAGRGRTLRLHEMWPMPLRALPVPASIMAIRGRCCAVARGYRDHRRSQIDP